MKFIKNTYIGSYSFYKKTSKIAIPLALQQMLSSAMGIIDSLMVSWIGFVSAVGTAAQIDFLCSMISYGAIGSTSIFAAQFFGAKDHQNLKRTFGFSLIIACINGLFWLSLAAFLGKEILQFYMDDIHIIENGLHYLQIAMFSYIPSCIQFAFSYMYRSIHKAHISLRIAIGSTILNTLLNYIFIFGIGSFPSLGVQGAALGTLIAQWCTVFIYFLHAYYTKQPFMGSFKETFSLNFSFVATILKKIYPLIINEALFGIGSTLFIKAFGSLGKDSMDAYYVSNQIANIFLFVVYGYGNSITILLGSLLGQGNIKQALKESRYHAGFSFLLAIILVSSMILCTKPMLSLFALETPLAYQLAILIMYVQAIKISMRLFNFMIFSVLRAGGDSKIISLLDSGIMWTIGIPIAFLSVHVFHIKHIAIVFLLTQLEQLIRMCIGMKRFYSNRWAQNLTTLISDQS